MKTKIVSLLHIANLVLLSACGQSTALPPGVTQITSGPLTPTTLAAEREEIHFIVSPILSKANILPLYPAAMQGGTYEDSAQVGPEVNGTVLASRTMKPIAGRCSDAPLVVDECPRWTGLLR